MSTTNVIVGIGDIKIAEAPNILETRGLGSCVGVTVYDTKKKIGGLAHVMLPCYSKCNEVLTEATKFRYANYSLPFMISKMIFMGCSTDNMIGKIFGGASMFKRKSKTLDIGKKNVEAAKKFLRDNSVKLVAQHVEGEMGRSIFFNLNSGVVKVIIYGKDKQEICL